MTQRKRTKVGWIPSDWDCAPFSSVFERVSEPVDVNETSEYQEIGIRSHGKGVFYKEIVDGRSLGNKRVFRCQPGTLVFNIVFAWEQAVAILGPESKGYIASHRFPMYRSMNGRCSESFVLSFFKSPRGKHGLGLASPGGAGRNKTLGQGELRFLFLPLPPIGEQSKISKIIATWDRGIEQLERLITAKERRKRGLMQELLTGRRRFPEFGSPVDDGTLLPGEWKVEPLSSIAEITFSGVDKKSHEGETPVQLCNYMDVYTNDYIAPSINFMDATASSLEIAKFSLRKGDVIITKDSETPDDIGIPAVVSETLDNVICGYHLALIRPAQERVEPLFLAKELSSSRGARYFRNHANGATRFGLTTSAVLKCPVQLPSLDEQRRIAAALKACDNELRQLCDQLAALKQQKKGLMQKLLSGEVRVPMEVGR